MCLYLSLMRRWQHYTNSIRTRSRSEFCQMTTSLKKLECYGGQSAIEGSPGPKQEGLEEAGHTSGVARRRSAAHRHRQELEQINGCVFGILSSRSGVYSYENVFDLFLSHFSWIAHPLLIFCFYFETIEPSQMSIRPTLVLHKSG